jgi:hypothetical protein
MATRRSALTLRGPLPHTLLDLIHARFDRVSTSDDDGAVLIVEDLDQASVRALLTLLWDSGHEVLSLIPVEIPTGEPFEQGSSS